MKLIFGRLAFILLAAVTLGWIPAHAQTKSGQPPNIVVIFADDVGIWDISVYHAK